MKVQSAAVYALAAIAIISGKSEAKLRGRPPLGLPDEAAGLGYEDAGSIDPFRGVRLPRLRDEDAGGFSVEAGYNKGPYNVKVKYERDEDEEDAGTFSPWQRPNPNRPPLRRLWTTS